MKSFFSSVPVVMCLLLSTSSFALEPQQFFQLRGGLCGAFASGTPNAYGIGAQLEPMFALTEQLSVGLRFDGAALFAVAMNGTQNVTAGLRGQGAALGKAELAFARGDIRPFLGLAGGYYNFGGTTGGTGGGSIEAGSGFGAAPQLGIDFSGFRLAGLYHFVFGASPVSGISRNFFALELSWSLL